MTDVERDALAWHLRGGHVGLKWVARKVILPDGREDCTVDLVVSESATYGYGIYNEGLYA